MIFKKTFARIEAAILAVEHLAQTKAAASEARLQMVEANALHSIKNVELGLKAEIESLRRELATKMTNGNVVHGSQLAAGSISSGYVRANTITPNGVAPRS